MPKEIVEARAHVRTNGPQPAAPEPRRHQEAEQALSERDEEIGCWDGIPQSS